MSIADVTSRLYSSSAYKNTSVAKALTDAVKMNLKFRFSVIGMAATLTRSQTLYQIAQQKYLISDEEKKQAKEEVIFKKYVVSSITTLSKQVAIIESIVEKNSLMINAISADLGFFKSQRRISPNSSYGSIKSFRMPVNSRSVKGRIDLINSELAALKGIRRGVIEQKQKKTIRDLENKEKEKMKALIGAAIAGTLGTLGVAAVGGTATAALIGGGAAALGGAYISSKVVEEAVKSVVKRSLPILGTAFKLSAAYTIGVGVAERTQKRLQGKSGVQTGDQEDYINRETDPEKYALRQIDIDLRKNLDAILEGVARPLDNAIAGLAAYVGVTNLFKLKDWASKNKGIMGGAASSAAAAAAGGRGVAGVAGVAGATSALGRGKPPMTGEIRGGRVWTGRGWKTLADGVPGAAVNMAPSAIRKRIVNRTVKRVLEKIYSGLKTASRKVSAVSLGLATYQIMSMLTATEQYENNLMSPEEYKQTMVNGYKGLIQTIGIGGISALAGTLIAGPYGALAGFAGGSLVGLTVGIFADKPTEWAAEQLFSMIHNMEPPPTQPVTADTAPSPPTLTATEADLQAFDRVQKFEGTDQIDGGMEAILATIRTKESGNNYKADVMKNADAQARAKALGYGKASASGAYQFVDSSWQGLTKKYGIGTQYQRAVDAPPDVQDLVAAAYVNEILIATGGDVSKVPVAWYTGNVEGKIDARALAMNPGLSVAKYQESWLSQYSKMGGAAGASMMAAQNAGVSVMGDRAADQAMLNYFISLGAGTVAQVPPVADNMPTAQASTDSSVAEGKADAALAAIKGTLQEVTRLAQDVKVLQQQNSLESSFPQVRPA